MAFIIANILPLETINELNEIYKLHIKRIKVHGYALGKVDDFSFYDRLMREDDEVIYERNTY